MRKNNLEEKIVRLVLLRKFFFAVSVRGNKFVEFLDEHFLNEKTSNLIRHCQRNFAPCCSVTFIVENKTFEIMSQRKFKLLEKAIL